MQAHICTGHCFHVKSTQWITWPPWILTFCKSTQSDVINMKFLVSLLLSKLVHFKHPHLPKIFVHSEVPKFLNLYSELKERANSSADWKLLRDVHRGFKGLHWCYAFSCSQFHQKHLCHVTLQSRLTQGPHQNHLYDSTAYGILSVSLLWGNTIRKQ